MKEFFPISKQIRGNLKDYAGFLLFEEGDIEALRAGNPVTKWKIKQRVNKNEIHISRSKVVRK